MNRYTTKKGQDSDACAGLPWDYQIVSDQNILSTDSARGKRYQYLSGSNAGGEDAYVNSDHVFEQKILKEFFDDDAPDQATDPDGCGRWQKFWVGEVNGHASKYGEEIGKAFNFNNDLWSRLSTIFRLLPGE